MTERENYLRTVAMTDPQWIPATVVISGASLIAAGTEFAEVMARHPLLYPDFRPEQYAQLQQAHRDGGSPTSSRDNWGCVYETGVEGLMGLVMDCPLADYEALESYQAPDPAELDDFGPADWVGRGEQMDALRAADRPVVGGMPHGFLFLRLWYLRGFENLMLDMAVEDPRLDRLIEIVGAHNRGKVDRWLKLGLDVLYFGEDMGTQTAPIISPRMFRRWFAGQYAELMERCHRAGTYTYLHSDGNVLELVDDWKACGVDIVNIQDLCNGIDNIAAEVKGRMCVALDIDRQTVVPFGSRADIHDLIEEEVRKLGSPRGGLELICGIYPPTPPESFDAVCEAIEKFRGYWWS